MSKATIINYLSNHALGLKRKTVILALHNSNWASAFDFVKEKLLVTLLRETIWQIEHTGSTSVPGLAAKPVLDILLILNRDANFNTTIATIEKLGFTYKGDGVALVQQTDSDPDRHFFSFYNDEENTDFIHLHMYKQGHEDIKRLLDFRNCLRKDVDIRNNYEKLKLDLWKNGHTRREFTRAKGEFIHKTIENLNN